MMHYVLLSYIECIDIDLHIYIYMYTYIYMYIHMYRFRHRNLMHAQTAKVILARSCNTLFYILLENCDRKLM